MQVAAARPDLAGILAADPGAVIETVAKDHGVTAREVVEALPAAMRRFAPVRRAVAETATRAAP